MKRLFISADIEGTCGIAHWAETDLDNGRSEYFRIQMSKEVASACKGAIRAGFDEIIIKDAHDSACNIIPTYLPRQAKIIRSWARNPLSMVAGVDMGVNAMICTGYHSAASMNTNPLAHTMTSVGIYSLKINGLLASEFVMNTYAAGFYGVPCVMLTGDKGLCESAKSFVKGIKTVPVSEGIGNASLSIHPELACELIEETAFEALSGDLKKKEVKKEKEYEVEVSYKDHFKAYRASFYPGAYAVDAMTTGFKSNDYFEVMKFYMFCI
ncbi:MAG: M55 family metallopeptidase [Clostridia bacterium]|nr:M55 family metallopeptidase [Clostridia bacterium]